MPPTRRRTSAQPARRPRVAGLRNRSDGQTLAADVRDDEDSATPEELSEVGYLDTSVIGETRRPQPREETEPERLPVEDAEEPERTRPAGDRKRQGGRSAPTGKRRSTGTSLPTGTVGGEPLPSGAAEDAEEDHAEGGDRDGVVEQDGTAVQAGLRTRRGLTGINLAIVLGLIAVVLASLAFWFRIESDQALAGSENVALTDSADTSEVAGQVRDAINTLFSYSYTDVAKSTEAAKNLIIGDAVGQYDQVMQRFTKDIQSQKLQVTVNTVRTGVVSLNGENARVMVFADQIALRAGQDPAGGPTQFAVNAQRQDGRWKIVSFDFFDAR